MERFEIMEKMHYGGWLRVWSSENRRAFDAQISDYLKAGSVPGTDFKAVENHAMPADAVFVMSKAEMKDMGWDNRADEPREVV